MKKLTKSDCGRPMTQEECRRVLVDMLDALARFCDENGLRYYLSGGTLLGAVRHKGFIPWDDDVDVNMPRPDCERLVALTGGMLGDYGIAEPFRDALSPVCEFYRLYDFDTVVENTRGGGAKAHPAYQPVFIDIFPIDGLPTDDRESNRLFRKVFWLRKMLRASSLRHMEGSRLSAHIFHLAAAIPARIVGREMWCALLSETQQSYRFDDQEYIGVTASPFHSWEEKIPRQEFLEPSDVEFEGKMYHGPKNYDLFLSRLYGDYMRLPPEEKRHSDHGFTMYWRAK